MDSGYNCFKNLTCGDVDKGMVEYGYTSCGDSPHSHWSSMDSDSENSEYLNLVQKFPDCNLSNGINSVSRRQILSDF